MRGWGADYWWQNERQPYYNVLAQGDLDTMRSFLDFVSLSFLARLVLTTNLFGRKSL